MKLAFIFDRLNDNKWHAPLIKEALKRGHAVEAWLNQRDVSQTTKWFEYPEEKKFPDFGETAKPVFKTFKNQTELAKLGENSDAKVVFASGPPDYMKPPGQLWAHAVPCFYDSLCAVRADKFDSFDIGFFNTPYWVEKCISYYEMTGQLQKGSALEKSFRSKWVSTGTTQFDHFYFCDKTAIRQKSGIPTDKKVVVVFAFETNATFWCQRIYLESRLWKRLWNVLVLPFSIHGIFSKMGKKKIFRLALRSLWQRPLFFSEAFTATSELENMRAIRKFCDANNCVFVLKARKKHNLSPYHLELPDLILREDKDYFPATPIQVLAAADLLITFYSTAAAEAACHGVPVLNVTASEDRFFTMDQFELSDLYGAPEREIANVETFYNQREGSVFQFKGIAQSWTANKVTEELPCTPWSAFDVDKNAHEAYLRKFISEKPGASSPRILDYLEKKLGKS